MNVTHFVPASILRDDGPEYECKIQKCLTLETQTTYQTNKVQNCGASFPIIAPISSWRCTKGGGNYPNMTVLLLGFEVQVTDKPISSYW